MPTYRNDSTERIVVTGQALDRGMSIATKVYNNNVTGLTKTADTPLYNPILHSEKVTTAKTVDVPAGENRFAIHMYVAASSGDVTVNFNTATNTPSLILYPGAKWNVRCYERVVNDIRFSGAGIIVYVIIELI